MPKLFNVQYLVADGEWTLTVYVDGALVVNETGTGTSAVIPFGR